VNIVAPGPVRTEATEATLTPEVVAALSRSSVLGRMLEPQDVASVIGSVVDGGFDAVAGINITVDGGRGVLAG
jgi:3-oxoacyl-[acyl-carrier protein] reductase